MSLIIATKKPVTVEAWCFDESHKQLAIVDWININGGRARHNPEIDGFIKQDGQLVASIPESISIFTLEGMMLARIGDYIIRGMKGEFYPCKPDIFELTYDYNRNLRVAA
jgi:hypothetical protein